MYNHVHRWQCCTMYPGDRGTYRYHPDTFRHYGTGQGHTHYQLEREGRVVCYMKADILDIIK